MTVTGTLPPADALIADARITDALITGADRGRSQIAVVAGLGTGALRRRPALGACPRTDRMELFPE